MRSNDMCCMSTHTSKWALKRIKQSHKAALCNVNLTLLQSLRRKNIHIWKSNTDTNFNLLHFIWNIFCFMWICSQEGRQRCRGKERCTNVRGGACKCAEWSHIFRIDAEVAIKVRQCKNEMQKSRRERGKTIQDREQEEICGGCSSSCWQSSVLLSQDLNHSHIQ